MAEIAATGGSSSSSLSGDTHVSTSSPSSTIFQNYPLLSALAAFVVAQSLKILTAWYKDRRWDARLLIGSGGMPSSHSASVTALAIAIGFQDGFTGSLFATAAILACIVMYDSSGVRLHAGRQAEVLNQIVFELPAEHPLAETRPLRELLGHTPPQTFPIAFRWNGFFLCINFIDEGIYHRLLLVQYWVLSLPRLPI